jgi:hypothetical protein
MRKLVGRGLFALVFLWLLVVTPSWAWGASGSVDPRFYMSPPGDNDGLIGSVFSYVSIDFWHYSGGFWRAGTADGGYAQVPDADTAWETPNLATMMGFHNLVKAALPTQVLDALAAGEDVAVVNNTYGLDQLIYMESGSSEPRITVSGNDFLFGANPRLNVYGSEAEDPSYRDFVSQVGPYVPLVKEGFGINLYSIELKSTGGNIGLAQAYFNPRDYNDKGPGIHHSQILDSLGNLEAGFSVTVYNPSTLAMVGTYDSADVKIASGFSSAGSVGVRFVYPFGFSFYRVKAADVAVTRIEPTEFTAGTTGVVSVTVKNMTDKAVSTPFPLNIHIYKGASYSGPGVYFEQDDGMTLGPNEERTVDFVFEVPEDGTTQMLISSEANPDPAWTARALKETDYSNNELHIIATVVYPPLPGTTVGCSDVLAWAEGHTHTRTFRRADGTRYTRPCHHTIYYQSELSETHTIDPSELKSGYGIRVDVSCTISNPHIIRNRGGCSWSEGPRNRPDPPSTVKVTMPKEVRVRLSNRLVQTQPEVVVLDRKSVTATQSIFEPERNEVSELYYGPRPEESRKIYVDVSVSGTKTRPVEHEIPIEISGGGIDALSIRWCKWINDATIRINGNMYEDDVTGAARAR